MGRIRRAIAGIRVALIRAGSTIKQARVHGAELTRISNTHWKDVDKAHIEYGKARPQIGTIQARIEKEAEQKIKRIRGKK